MAMTIVFEQVKIRVNVPERTLAWANRRGPMNVQHCLLFLLVLLLIKSRRIALSSIFVQVCRGGPDSKCRSSVCLHAIPAQIHKQNPDGGQILRHACDSAKIRFFK